MSILCISYKYSLQYVCWVISVTLLSAGLFWATINELLSSFLFWFKTEQYATTRWKNAVVAETAAQRYEAAASRVKHKIFSYYNKQVSACCKNPKNEIKTKRTGAKIYFLKHETFDTNHWCRIFDNFAKPPKAPFYLHLWVIISNTMTKANIMYAFAYFYWLI